MKWPNSRYCLRICLEGLRNIMKNLSQDSISHNSYLNPGPPKYRVLTTKLLCSV
jgi:hypothetical protein